MGWEDAKDDYAVLDEEKSVGRIYKEHGEAKWFWQAGMLWDEVAFLLAVRDRHPSEL
jgi:hypothetical protein